MRNSVKNFINKALDTIAMSRYIPKYIDLILIVISIIPIMLKVFGIIDETWLIVLLPFMGIIGVIISCILVVLFLLMLSKWLDA